MSFFILTPAVSPVPTPFQGLGLVNGNFETGSAIPPTGWSAGGLGLTAPTTISYDTSTPYDGTQSVVINGPSGSGIISNTVLPAIPGQTFVIQGAVMSTAGETSQLTLNFLDVNGNVIGQILVTNTANSWVYVNYLSIQNNNGNWGDAPAGTVSAQVSLSLGSSGTVEFDDIVVGVLTSGDLVTPTSAAGIFDPVELPQLNSDLQQASLISPTSQYPSYWGEPQNPSSLNTNWDYTTPYTGTQSFIIENSDSGGGVVVVSLTNIQYFATQPGQVLVLGAAMKYLSTPASNNYAFAVVEFFDQNLNSLSSLGAFDVQTVSLVWQFQFAVGVTPPGAAFARITMGTQADGQFSNAEFGLVTLGVSNAAQYYLNKYTSEYQLSPQTLALTSVLLQPLILAGVCAAIINDSFSINSAEGAQLDVLGVILGASRTLPFALQAGIATAVVGSPAGSGYVVGDILTVTQGGANGGTVEVSAVSSGIPTGYAVLTPGVGYSNASNLATTGGTGTNAHVTITTFVPSSMLDDSHYRLLLQAKILKNQWNGQADSLWQPWQAMFPGGSIFITDNQNMTCDVLLIGVFDNITQQMITGGLIVPRPEGVLYVYLFPALPIFGFDNLNPSLIAGFDTGFWT